MLSPQAYIERYAPKSGERLFSLYLLCLAWFILAVECCMLIGIEPIYKNVTPFYAFALPAASHPSASLGALAGVLLLVLALCFTLRMRVGQLRPVIAGAVLAATVALLALASDISRHAVTAAAWWDDVKRYLPVTLVIGVSFAAAWRLLRNADPSQVEFSAKQCRRIVFGLVVFSFVFAGSIAMIRGGFAGIAAAYSRTQYEYVDDIGKGLTLLGFLRDYNELHPHLSMHAKVHPPGPVVLLWLLSSVLFTRDALILSLATMAVGSLAILPLFALVRDMAGQSVALVACAFYALMPSIVLFTATSADIMFMPIQITTLFLFWRAIDRGAVAYAAAAGVGYALMSLTSFSLLTVGAFFGFVGLWKLSVPGRRFAVVKTALVMSIAFVCFHGLVRVATGFDIIECFRLSHAQFTEDQVNLDITAPRYASWAFKFFNPMCFAFFAGIPATLLFLWRLLKPDAQTRPMFIACGLTLAVIVPLYLARGEGERSAMYILPFILIPAAHLLEELVRKAKSWSPMAFTFFFLMLQSWLIESLLFTYW